VAPAADLEISALHRDLGAMLFAVCEAPHDLWRAVRDSGFDDSAFEAPFT